MKSSLYSSFILSVSNDYFAVVVPINQCFPLREKRFEEIFTPISWIDPKKWEDDRQYAHSMLEIIYSRFLVPLDKARYNPDVAFKEWKNFEIYVESAYSTEAIVNGNATPSKIWKNIQFKT